MMNKIFKKSTRAFSHLPPTAVPVQVGDVKSAVRMLFKSGSDCSDFVSELENVIGAPNCFLTSSGRAALLIILLTLKQRSDRLEVILPAYTCPTVAQAVIRAGLQPLFCDVDPHTLGFDRDHLKSLLSENVLSIIPTHLYGLAQDFSDFIGSCKDLGVYIIEDAAQAFGAVVSGQMVGTLGDFGIFSLGFGKCIPAGHGGVICTKADFAPGLEKTFAGLKTNHASSEMVSLGEFLAYGLATTPVGWWLVFRSPWNPAKQEMQINTLPPINCGGLNAVQVGIGSAILKRIDHVNRIRRKNAASLKRYLRDIRIIEIPEIDRNTDPVYLRFPVIADNKMRADQLYRRLSKAGIGVSRSYTYTLPDLFVDASFIKSMRFKGAERLAECILTLPTHPYVKEKDLLMVKKIFETAGSEIQE